MIQFDSRIGVLYLEIRVWQEFFRVNVNILLIFKQLINVFPLTLRQLFAFPSKCTID